MRLTYPWHFRRCTCETGLATENHSSWKNWEKSYDEIIRLDDGTRRGVVNARLVFVTETYEAPYLLVKFKLLATSVIPTRRANPA